MIGRLTAILLLSVTCLLAQNKPADTLELHGTYEELQPAQKKLIDEWYADYNRMSGDHSDPAEYNTFSLSTRTTFEAVTHALMTTNLTDSSGKSMGNALDLVQGIEAINGKVPKARGDLQFRVYVQLKPDAIQKLKDSTEFFRDRDNTVFHYGYPINYRQGGGDPSIQISMAKDQRHADIDVDYRSSRFPQALVNGHLTAANSDVRAGSNTQRHQQRWAGLEDWWHNLFGLGDSTTTDDTTVAEGEIPAIPRQGSGKLKDAAQDFLTSWLVDQKPELSAAYLSPRSYACLEEYGPQSGREVNAGVAPYLAMRDMAATNRLIGKVANLQAAVQPETLQGPGLRVSKEDVASAFSIYKASNAAAAEFVCDPDKAFDEFEKARTSGTAQSYGRYFVSAFRLKAPQDKSDAITLLWTKEGKYWKVVAWNVEPQEGPHEKIPDTRSARVPAVEPVTTVTKAAEADPGVEKASHDFLHAWFVEDNFDRAADYFSPRSEACADMYTEGQVRPTPADYEAFLRKALGGVGAELGNVQHLRDALEPVQPQHEDLLVLAHQGEGAYSLVAVPDHLAATMLCQKHSHQQPYEPAVARQKVYGNYYAAIFALRTPGQHPAALTLLWGKEGGQWKIVAYELTAM